MKKLIILFMLFLTASGVLAYEHPRWVAQPIYVYIPEYGEFSGWMKQAFDTWEQNSQELIRFKYVSSPSNANIRVDFVDFVTNCNSKHSVGCTHTVKRGKNYAAALITIGTKAKNKINQNGQIYEHIGNRNPSNIYGVMLHEVGHALGLNHSENPESIMFPYDLQTLQYLTEEDLRLLYNKYY